MASSSGGLLRYTDAAATLDAVYRLSCFTETWFKSLVICLSSLWLILRVYQVFLKPVGELITLLGLEVPAQPTASLAGIKADGVTLHWKLGDNTVTKWQVAINGIGIGELAPKETSVTVYGLQPESSYTARLVAHNAHFQTASLPVRFTTLPTASNLYYQGAKDDADAEDGDQPNQQPRQPMLKAARALFDPTQLPSAQPMTREHSSSISQRRNTQARRVSPILTDIAIPPGDDNSEAVRDLTTRLDALRRDNEEAERQEREEHEESENMRKALEEERDRYRKQLKEKDDTSRELKKEVTRLERANTSVQGSKNNAERKLQHKHNDRQKLKDDIARWDREVEEMRTAVQRLHEQKEALEEETEHRLDAYRDQLTKGQESNRTLEEDIKDTSMQIKSLEQEKRKNSDGDDDIVQQAPDALDEEERAFEGRLRSLQGRYTDAWNNMIQAEATFQNCQRHLMFLGQQRRQSTSHVFAPTPAVDAAPRRRISNSRGRNGSVMGDMQSPTIAAFGAMGALPTNGHSVSSASPTFASLTSPFFNMTNGMTFDTEQLQRPERNELSEAGGAEIIAGAPMSPSTAGALLPSNLFGDDGASTAASDIEPGLAAVSENAPKPSFMNYRRILNDDASSLNHNSNRNSAVLPGLGAIPGLGAASAAVESADQRAPSSPTSADSGSPSRYASPRVSTNYLPHKDSFNEIDRRSIRSNTNSSLGPKGRSRFFDGLSRLGQRAGKASQDEGPALGSLKTSQTRSMPRQDLTGHSSNDSKRRGSHSGSGWMGMPSISQAFSRSGKDAEATSVHSTELPKPSRMRPFGFGRASGEDPWFTSSLLSRGSVPRPSSTHSSDNSNALPRPETGSETRFGWPVDAGLNERQLISPLSVDWATRDTPGWSRQPSRRPSVQYGPSGLGPDMAYDDDLSPPARRSPAQAPIGTRPQTAHGQGSGSGSGAGTSTSPTPDPLTAKPSLNPAAPSFSLSFLSRNKKSEDGEGASTPKSEKRKDRKGKGKDKDRLESAAPFTAENVSLETPKADVKDSSSPPESRRSKDTRSISTADGSFLDSSVASIPRSSLEQTRSQTPSEVQGGALTNSAKESFMQKLSRKTSQTGVKLSRPFSFTARKSTATASPALEGRESALSPDEGDEDLTRSIESIHFTPSGALSVANSPVVNPSFDAGEEGSVDGRKERRGKAGGKGWGSLKLSSRRDRKRAGETEAESVTASEADTADEDGRDSTA